MELPPDRSTTPSAKRRLPNLKPRARARPSATGEDATTKSPQGAPSVSQVGSTSEPPAVATTAPVVPEKVAAQRELFEKGEDAAKQAETSGEAQNGEQKAPTHSVPEGSDKQKKDKLERTRVQSGSASAAEAKKSAAPAASTRSDTASANGKRKRDKDDGESVKEKTIGDFIKAKSVGIPTKAAEERAQKRRALAAKKKSGEVGEDESDNTRNQAVAPKPKPPPAPAPAPRPNNTTTVQIIDGKMVLNTESVVPDVPVNHDDYEVVYESKARTSSASYLKKTPGHKWTNDDTDKFYEAIERYGTDFTLIETVLAPRERRQIKNKFKKEERANPTRIEAALKKYVSKGR